MASKDSAHFVFNDTATTEIYALSLHDALPISLAERESAKRDYIASLESYWESLRELRILTLYDFETREKITYVNPMLQK